MANMVTYPLNKIEYQASDAETHFSTRVSGVYSGDDFNCSVTGADTVVTVSEGLAWIRNKRFAGKSACLPNSVSVDLGVANASLPRWDVVCIQFDATKNATDIVVKNGTPASSPVMPAISQTETLYELYLCKVYRPAGSAYITAGNVYDLRFDETVCGLMADSVTEIDTSAINRQVTELIGNLKEQINNVGGTGDMKKSVYDTNNNGVVDKAETANKMTTPVKIGNASFDGSKDISLSQIGAATSEQGTKADNAMPKVGGKFTGSIEVAGGIKATGNIATDGVSQSSAIELYRDVPFIDFHYGKSNTDYTSRIAEETSGNLNIHAGVNITGSFTNNSDRRLKENIIAMRDNQVMPLDMDSTVIDIYSELFDRLIPSQYTMKDGDGKIIFGLVAQDIVEAMADVGIGENELDLVHHRHWNEIETGEAKEQYSVGYINLIAMLIHEVQKLKARIDRLEEKI